MRTPRISNAIIKRLPIYRRYLRQLKRNNVTKVSSNELSAIIGFTASQIRQDFNTFAQLGQQGYGYEVDKLLNELDDRLGLGHDRVYNTVVIGAGNIGKAISNYTYYYDIGFKIIGIFDANPDLVGTECNEIVVQNISEMDDFARQNSVDVGIICVNRENAQAVADQLVDAGVRGIWNFAPIDLEIPSDVALESVHLSDSLHILSYRMKTLEDEK